MTVSEAKSLVNGLGSIFDIARLVDPGTRHVIDLNSGEDVLREYPCFCFDIWDRGTVCEHCLCGKTIAENRRHERVEMHKGRAYHVVCAPLEVAGRTYELECVSHTDDEVLKGALGKGRLEDAYKERNSDRYTDALTGVYNFRYYQDTYVSLEGEQAAALIEIDDLIGIRAEYGERGADLFIRRVAGVIREHVRGSDVIIRTENDRFLLLFRMIGREAFLARMERIRQAVGSVRAEAYPGARLSLSIGGLYGTPEDPIRPDKLVARLNHAREKGNSFFCPREAFEAEAEHVPSGKEQAFMTFSSDFHSIFAVDLSTGHMETVQAEGENEQWIRATAETDYETYRKAFSEKFILPEDRDWFLAETEKEAVLRELGQNEVLYINHRIIKNGAAHYYQTKFARDPRSDSMYRVLLGGHSVDAQTRREINRIESQQRQEKALRDCIGVLYSGRDIYEALRELLKKVTEYYGAERAYICELDGERRFALENYQFYRQGAEHADLEDLVRFDTLCFPAWENAFRSDGQLLIEVPQTRAAFVPAHELMQANGVERMILAPIFSGEEIGGFVGVDNPAENYHDLFLLRSVAAFAYSELLRRKLKERENDEQLAVIAGLATNYVHVSIADLKSDHVTVFRMSPELDEAMIGWEDITDYRYKLQMFLDRVVVPEDREALGQFMRLEHIESELKKVPAIYKNFTVLLGGRRVAYQTKVVRCGKGREDSVLIGLKNVEEERHKERQIREQLEITVAERTRELQERNRLLNRLNEDVIEFLGGLTEARDKESGEHINRVKGYTNILARKVMEKYPEYALTEEKVEIITSASALHDLGKIMIPDEVLLKPGRLSDNEYAVMKTHCVRGAEILRHSPRGWSGEYLQTSLDIVLCHHEKVDGRGYPRGLSGDAIPISAQIVSVADCYDALTTKRVYKDAYTPEKAFEMILNGQCGAFSGKILTCLRECREQFERYYRGEMDAQADSGAALYTAETLAGLRILIAEDNDIARSILQDILEGEGAFVLSAADGQEALRTLCSETRRVDAVLTDINMPNLDGFGLAEAIRLISDERIRNVPILAITGYSDEETERRCRLSGMDAFITKPVNISVLTQNLLRCLKKETEKGQVNTLGSPVQPNPVPGALRMGEYTEMVQQLAEKLITGELEPFAMLDADVNDLKKVNRLYGHEAGDRYLESCWLLLNETFPESHVYRIGGDEFAVIVTGGDYEKREDKLELLRKKIESSGPLPDGLDGRVSFAFGMGVFDREHDMSVSSVFERAEQAMLAHKRALKEK